MPRFVLSWLALAAASACIIIPPPESKHLAEATFDFAGGSITGGALTVAFPEGAVDLGTTLRVTIDLAPRAPDGYLQDVYVVSPAGTTLSVPVYVTYQFDEAAVAGVVDRDALYVGAVAGSSWQPLDEQRQDLARFKIQGSTARLSVFGLIDPARLPQVDGGTQDGA
ncbi:MAG: hypothetical protein JXR83_18605 [Deltaproteobacteria bacterium]|nr:hypothetical protein [Deltaproteobacteria bacterium]